MSNHVNVLSTSVISDGFFRLENIVYEINQSDGKKVEQKREIYNTADGATALLYNLENETVILIKQFRLSTHLNGNEGGMFIEACAGLIEPGHNPQETIIREIEEETGYQVDSVEKIFELHSSPGATTEKLYYFVAPYHPLKKKHEGGGLQEEEEDIEVLELPFADASLMAQNGTIRDAKTIILLQYAQMNIFKSNKVFDVL